jgi:hypothetical protein
MATSHHPSLNILSTPKTVHQDNFDPGRGNALQAVIASIFGLALKEVPNFIELPIGYEAAIKSFCSTGGVESTKIKLTSDHDLNQISNYDGKLCCLRGKSPRGDFGHVVVARLDGDRFEFVHDPHPDGTMLDTSEGFGWCMFFS